MERDANTVRQQPERQLFSKSQAIQTADCFSAFYSCSVGVTIFLIIRSNQQELKGKVHSNALASKLIQAVFKCIAVG